MTPSSLRRSIKDLLDLLAAKDIALLANPVVEKRNPSGVTRITWAPSRGQIGALFRGESATIDEYCSWLDAQAYSALLYDGALVQMTYDMLGREVIGHRLAYIPCPFDVDPELLREQPVLDVIDLYRRAKDAEVKLRSPLRFDYDPENQDDGHPSAHLTLLFSHCRWAVSGPLSLGHFVRFLFRNFYPDLWNRHEFLREWPQRPLSDERTITTEEATMLHVAWAEERASMTRTPQRHGKRQRA